MKTAAAWLVALLLSALAGPAAAAVAADVALEVAPAAVAFEPPRSAAAELLVSLHNRTHVPLAAATLTAIAPSGITATIKQTPSLPSADDLVWQVTLQAAPGTPAQSSLILRLDWRGAATTGAKGVTIAAPRATVAATVTITYKDAASPAHVLTAKLLPESLVVDELTPRTLRLQLDNAASKPVEVSAIGVVSPPWVELIETPPPLTVAPMQSVAQSLTVKTTKDIVPGSYPLLLSFVARYADGPKDSADTLLAASKVDIGVPGLSETMQLLGLPSFLLLPGMLMLTSFGLGWAWIVRRPAEKFPLDWKSAGFLMFAITFSGLAAVIFPRLGARLGINDYLHGFNLGDVVRVWLLSLGLGLIAIPIGYGMVGAGRAVRDWVLHARRPRETDDARTILRKLGLHAHGLTRASARQRPPANPPDAPGDPRIALRLPFDTGDAATVWLVPRATVTMRPEAPAELGVQLDTALAEAAMNPRHILALSKLLAEHRSSLTVAWEESFVAQPTRFALAQLDPPGANLVFISRA